MAQEFTLYFPTDGARDCGDGALQCPSEFVFQRVPLEPRLTADPTGTLPGVYFTYNAVDPATIVDSTTSYSSAGPNSGLVGRSLVYVIRSVNDGATWSDPTALASGGVGHQYFSDIDANAGTIAAVWQDSITDPCYSVQLPFGNTAGATSCGTNIITTRFSASDNGTTWGPAQTVSSVSHQPQYEMFSNRDIPFQGDYNWISLVDAGAAVFGYMSWTDNRDVQVGTDPREETQDGFDVRQCRTETDGTFGPDTCPNAGGLDQNIYGTAVDF
jgi:hypothetical protein